MILQDGSVLQADKIVFSGSLGVLKSGIVDFDPPLPFEKQKAIEKIGFGTLGKIFIEFDQPWVAEDWVTGFGFMFKENDVNYRSCSIISFQFSPLGGQTVIKESVNR